MKNKLGIDAYKLLDIEKEIVSIKLNLLDDRFTFNKDNLDLDYLIELHKFLFGEFYYEEDLGLRLLTEKELKIIKCKLNKILEICINNPNDIESIILLIEEIWHLQPFILGNTRTMIAYLKIIDKCFLLNQNVNVNVDITSKFSIFKEVCNVNQKRLTKVK